MLTESEAVAALEQNAWSMFAQFGRVEPGRLIDTPTRSPYRSPRFGDAPRRGPYETGCGSPAVPASSARSAR